MRRLFHVCKLVHADLSEYNILYHDSHLYIIDVSQSVEHDHPSAFDFLRSDIRNIEAFFGRDGVQTLGPRRLFEFVTHEDITQGKGEDLSALEATLREWMGKPELEADPNEASTRAAQDETSNDAVFLKSYIPRTLNDVYDPERDIARLQRGEGKDLIYGDLTGVVQIHEGKKDQASDSEQDSSEESEYVEKKPRGKRHEDKEIKKVESPI